MDIISTNILSVIAAPHWGGLQVVVERTAPYYRDAGFRRFVALPDRGGGMRERLEMAGCVVIPLDLGRPRKTLNPVEHCRYLRRFAHDVAAIESIIATHEIDVVEVAGLLNFQPVVAARRTGTPLVWQMHSTLAPAAIRRAVGRVAASTADVIMTSGAAMASRHGGIEGGPAEVIPFCAPIDLERFDFRPDMRQEVRSELGFAPGDIVIGTLGNRGWQKRHEWIVKIADRLRDRDLRFAIIGTAVETNDRYYDTHVLKPIKALGLDNVRVIDQRRPAYEMMNALDVFILPSVAEGASLVTAEAMASALPIIASDVGSLSDIVSPDVNGFLCDAASLDEFCAAINRLKDPELRRRMGHASRQLAHTAVGSERCATAHFRAYTQAKASRAAR